MMPRLVKLPSSDCAHRHLTRCLLAPLVGLLGACGGATQGPTAGTAAGLPSVTSISAAALRGGQPATFTVAGANLPTSATLVLADGSCQAPSAMSPTGFTLTCTPGNGSSLTGTVYTAPPTAGGYWLGQQIWSVTPSTPITLTDTGIGATQCYAAGSATLAYCNSPAALALNDKQDGMLGDDVTSPDATDGPLGLRYALADAEGRCVKDLVTGLVWQRNPTALTALPGREMTNEAQALASQAGGQVLCGRSDWRLPDRLELQQLLSLGATTGATATDWLSVNASAPWQFSGSAYSPNPANNSWVVNAISGTTSTLGDPAVKGVSLRLVAGALRPSTGHYSLSTDGAEVTDNWTGLIWRRCLEGTLWNGLTCLGTPSAYTHESALAAARGQTGWRVPNVKELASLNADEMRAPALDAGAFVGSPATALWSSTPAAQGSDQAWAVDFASYGSVAPMPRSTATLNLRLMR